MAEVELKLGCLAPSPCPFHVPEGLYATSSWNFIPESTSGDSPGLCGFLAGVLFTSIKPSLVLL